MSSPMVQQFFRRFHVPPELLERAGIRHGTDAEVRELLGINGRTGQDLSGIIIPYRDPRDWRSLNHRVRLDTPTGDGKYLSEAGCRYLFFPPLQGGELSDVSVRAVLVEAEKSALALTALSHRHALRLLPIAVGGAWGWKRRNGLELKPDGSREPVTASSL